MENNTNEGKITRENVFPNPNKEGMRALEVCKKRRNSVFIPTPAPALTEEETKKREDEGVAGAIIKRFKKNREISGNAYIKKKEKTAIFLSTLTSDEIDDVLKNVRSLRKFQVEKNIGLAATSTKSLELNFEDKKEILVKLCQESAVAFFEAAKKRRDLSENQLNNYKEFFSHVQRTISEGTPAQLEGLLTRPPPSAHFAHLFKQAMTCAEEGRQVIDLNESSLGTLLDASFPMEFLCRVCNNSIGNVDRVKCKRCNWNCHLRCLKDGHCTFCNDRSKGSEPNAHSTPSRP